MRMSLTLVVRKEEMWRQVIHVESIVLKYFSVANVFIDAYCVFESAQTFAAPYIFAGIERHENMKILIVFDVLYLLIYSLGAFLLDIRPQLLPHFIRIVREVN